MNFVKIVKMGLVTGFLVTGILGQPLATHAEESGGGGDIIVFDIVGVSDANRSTATDDVIVDGKIITAENYDASASGSDSEWKYVPVRRTASP